jgi:hypothetical protein
MVIEKVVHTNGHGARLAASFCNKIFNTLKNDANFKNVNNCTFLIVKKY